MYYFFGVGSLFFCSSVAFFFFFNFSITYYRIALKEYSHGAGCIPAIVGINDIPLQLLENRSFQINLIFLMELFGWLMVIILIK